MSAEHDDAMERLLSRGTGAFESRPAGTCLDPETVAGWFEGRLHDAERRAAEQHASACERCQSVLAAMAQSAPRDAVASSQRVSRVRWLVPALAAAAVVVFLVDAGVRRQLAPAPPSPRVAEATNTMGTAAPPTAAPPSLAPEAPRFESQRALKPLAQSQRKPQRQALTTTAATDAIRQGVPAASPPAPPPTAAAPAASAPEENRGSSTLQKTAKTAASLDRNASADVSRDALTASQSTPTITSPDGVTWRFAGADTIAHSADGGATWTYARLAAPARLVAGAAPLANVVWFAGAKGIIVHTVDGRTWQRSSLPEALDLVSMTAIDGETATVTAADGRRFTTHDGGRTWSPASLQESPAAPF